MEWSKDDAARARADGWALTGGGYIRPTYLQDGSSMFSNQTQLREFIMSQAAADGWYRDMYLASAISYHDIGEARMRFGIHWLHGDIPERTGEVLALAAKDGDLLAMKLVAYLTKLRFTRRE